MYNLWSRRCKWRNRVAHLAPLSNERRHNRKYQQRFDDKNDWRLWIPGSILLWVILTIIRYIQVIINCNCFADSDDDESPKVLRHLELIDDEASQYGVRIVKIDDPLMSKKYGHRNPPGLGYFRKGNYIKYDGKSW